MSSRRRRRERCDCADPECGLPIGRCYLCGAPTDKANVWAEDSRVEWTVCVRCKSLARAGIRLLKLNIRLAGLRTCARGCCGLALFNGHRYGPAEIQRCDACAYQRGVNDAGFAGDDEAALVLAGVLGINPAYPDGA